MKKLNKKDIKYIEENLEKLTPEVISLNINKPLTLVRRWISENIDSFLDRTTTIIINGLKKKPEWKELEKQLVEEEKNLFLTKWAKIIKQFGEGTTPSEEMQLLLLLKYDLLIDRNMVEQRIVLEQLLELRREHEALGAQFVRSEMSGEQLDQVAQVENRIGELQASQQGLNSELKDLTANHEKMMKGLKATRDQRIDRIENSRHTFLDVLKELDNKAIQDREGRMLGLARASMDKEAHELGNLHTYEANGEIDRPLLNCDTVSQEENIVDVPE